MLLVSAIEVERSLEEVPDDSIAMDELPYDDLRSTTRDLADDDDDDSVESEKSGVALRDARLPALPLRQTLLLLLRRRPR